MKQARLIVGPLSVREAMPRRNAPMTAPEPQPTGLRRLIRPSVSTLKHDPNN